MSRISDELDRGRFEILERERAGTSSLDYHALYTISTWRYRVCRLLQRDESGRRNVRLANSVLDTGATHHSRCYRGFLHVQSDRFVKIRHR